MNRIRLISLLSILLASFAQADIKPLTAADVGQLQNQYAGENRIVVLWSVDCPPCHQELNMLGKLLDEKPELPLVFVNTDETLAPEEIETIVAKYGLQQANHWQFADPVSARLRAALDASWYGELPRSYLLAEDGQAQAHSGLLPEGSVREWLGL